jgi:hypothetical protein
MGTASRRPESLITATRPPAPSQASHPPAPSQVVPRGGDSFHEVGLDDFNPGEMGGIGGEDDGVRSRQGLTEHVFLRGRD